MGDVVSYFLADLAHMARCLVGRHIVSFVAGCRWTNSHVAACKVLELLALVAKSHVRSIVIGTPGWEALLGCWLRVRGPPLLVHSR